MKNTSNSYMKKYKATTVKCIVLFIIIFIAFLFFGECYSVFVNRDEERPVYNSQKEIYTQDIISNIDKVTTHAISTTTLLVNALAAVMTGISLISLVLTITNSTQIKEILDKANNIEKVGTELKGVKSAQNIISGILYRKDEKYKYAIEEFETAIKFCDDDCECEMRANYELGHTYAEIYAECFKKGNLKKANINFEKAVHHLEIIINHNKDNGIIYEESNFELGVLYGVKAENCEGANIEEYLQKSQKYLEKAIKIKDNFLYNSSIAVTYALMGKIDTAVKCLERSIFLLENDSTAFQSRDKLLGVFSLKAKNMIGLSWNKIENSVKYYNIYS